MSGNIDYNIDKLNDDEFELLRNMDSLDNSTEEVAFQSSDDADDDVELNVPDSRDEEYNDFPNISCESTSTYNREKRKNVEKEKLTRKRIRKQGTWKKILQKVG